MTASRKLTVLYIAWLTLTYAYFHQPFCWAQNAHFDLAMSIGLDQRFDITRWENTGDSTVVNGKTYSNKSPGLGMLASPIIFVATRAMSLVGISSTGVQSTAWLLHLCLLICVALPSALTSWLIYSLARRWVAGRRAALFASLTYSLGTPIFAYSTSFWSHATTAFFLLSSFDLAVLNWGEPRRVVYLRRLGLVTLLAAIASALEYPAFPPAVALIVLAAWGGAERPAKWGPRFLAIAAGGIVPAALVLFYLTKAFGDPFSLSYRNYGTYNVQAGLFGVTFPKWDVMWALLVPEFRGILPIAPALICAPWGFWLAYRKAMGKAFAAVALAIPVFYYLLNSSYQHWHAGWTYGPRYLAAGLPFVCLFLAFAFGAAKRWMRGLMIAGSVWGFALAFMVTSTYSSMPHYTSDGSHATWVRSYSIPKFFAGQIAQSTYFEEPILPHEAWRIGRRDTGWNGGTMLGLRGLWSLLPLLLGWFAVGLYARRLVTAGGTLDEINVSSSSS